jgi:light-regulated signal transduction histidine kinase (bacteriophytochrome)
MGNSVAKVTGQPFEIGKGSELRRVRTELEQRTAELEHARGELKELASSVSHDLAQPLTTIAGFADLLSKRYEGQLDADADEFIAFILKGVGRMQSMIEDLVAYLRTTESEFLEAEVNLSQVLGSTVNSLTTPIAEADASVVGEPLPNVRGDAIQLGQVFRNLISNSLAFINDEPPRIHISAESYEEGVCVSVADNGIGMDGNQAVRAFELFQRFQSSPPGNGVGLAICRKIIERHGGRIWVERRDEGGSVVRFRIPDRGRVT